MRRIFILISIVILTSAVSFAQTDGYKKGEVFLGYSNGQVDTGLDSDDLDGVFPTNDFGNFHGFNVSGVYNVNRFIGIKGDVSGTYNKTSISQGFIANGTTFTVGLDTKSSLYNFLGGVQVKDNSNSGRFKPFAHALVGAAHIRSKVNNFTCTPAAVCPPTFEFNDETFSDTGLAGAFGGGIDIRVTNRVQIRAIQIDYNPIRADGVTSHNVRFGVGIVF
jgi:opacity protein-like surface antigen